MSKLTIDQQLFAQIVQLLQAARQNIVRSVNQTMVYTYYEIGRMIVEDEQQGKERAGIWQESFKRTFKAT